MNGASPRCERGRAARPRGSSRLRAVHARHADELAVQALVAAQLGMKAKREDASLADGDGMVVVAGDHLHAARPFDQRRADEDTWKRLAIEAVYVEGRLEAVDLAAVAVAAHADVEHAQTVLLGHPVGDVARKHDHAGARGESRQPVLDRFPQWLQQSD